ncbi:MAG: efflux RND transporter periplasmic adaptor subunit [Pseudomonadota bacterium]
MKFLKQLQAYLLIKNRKKRLILLLILSIGGTFYYIFHTSSMPEPIVKVVEVINVKLKCIEQTVRLIGTTRAKRATSLIVKTSGVLEILKRAGTLVTKDTMIARINNPDIEKRYESALAAAQIAKDQYERIKTLTKTGTASKQSAEEKQAALLEAEGALATAKIELDKIRFYAPFDGVIGAYKVRDGAEINVGAQLVTFYDPTSMIVEFDIPAPLLASIDLGQKVMINEKVYKVSEVQKMLDESTHMAPATVDIEASTYIIGITVNVDLTVSEKNNVIVLPEETVFLEQGKPHVYVIKDSKTVLTPIDVGIRARDQVEITKGLHAGDVVVSQAQSRLSKDTVIKIHDPKEVIAAKKFDMSSKK